MAEVSDFHKKIKIKKKRRLSHEKRRFSFYFN
jgi:hypothetical protein